MFVKRQRRKGKEVRAKLLYKKNDANHHAKRINSMNTSAFTH